VVMEILNHVKDWLLDADPSIRWQVMADILDISSTEVNEERSQIALKGWASTILSEQNEDGTWDSGSNFPEMHTLRVLCLLCDMGLDPDCIEAKTAINKIQNNVVWLMNISKEELPKDEEISWWHNAFFEGEVEPCINGRVLRVGAYFGVNVQPLVDRLLHEQMEDGGWNCDQEIGSTRGSFHTTINVLEGLLEFELASGTSHVITKARERGHEYLLKRHLFKRLETGEPIKKDRKGSHDWTIFSYPSGWRYDILRGFDYLRKAKVLPDPRMIDAIKIVKSNRDENGTWSLGVVHEEEPIAEPGIVKGTSSYWNTLRALRVLKWYAG